MTGTINTIAFFVGILAVYYIVPVKLRWLLLLGGSAVFYASAGLKMSVLMAGSIVISYYTALKIDKAESEKIKKKWMTACIVFLVMILFVFKYFNFFIESINRLFALFGMGSTSFAFQLMIPLGISYYTFKMISYLVDVYEGKIEAEKHLGYYGLYVSFFPQILCGPIERAENFLPQIKKGCKFAEPLFTEGMERVVIGMFKKLVIADQLGTYVEKIFAAPMEYPGLASILAVAFYSIQIYCDFSGYSDMAIGMAKMLGIQTKENFWYPYFTKNIKEFWKCWHISLSSWLRDYVYIPLGGNRKGKLRAKVNLMITFLVSGLWHGSSWSFVFWGGLHGIWNILSNPSKEKQPGWKKVLQMIATFCGITFTWIFFRAASLSDAWTMIKHSIVDFSISKTTIYATILPVTGNNTCVSQFLMICILVLFLTIFEWRRSKGKGTAIGWFVVMFSAVLLLGQFGSSSFLYGQF